MGVLENKARVRLFYKYLSGVYDWVSPLIWNEEMRGKALEILDIQQGDRVLDVGRGAGFGTEGLLRYTDGVHGLDQSIHQMQKAWKEFGKHDEVRFYHGDAERLPPAEDSFNVIRSSGFIKYWPSPITALEEFRRVVKPGSKALVIDPDDPKSGVFQKLADAIMLFCDEEGADRVLEAAGFVDIEHHILQRRPGGPRAIVTIARAPKK